jgi:hypothetical protein
MYLNPFLETNLSLIPPDSYLKIKQSQSDLLLQEFIDNNPEVKASMDMGNLLSNSPVSKNKKKNGLKSYTQDIKNLYSIMDNT